MTRLDDQKEDVFVEIVDMDTTAEEVVTENADGSYTIFINARIAYDRQQEAIQHAIRHITDRDFEKEDVQQIEAAAHQIADNDVPVKHVKVIEKHLSENYIYKRNRAFRMSNLTKAERKRMLEAKIRRARIRMMEAQDEETYYKYKQIVWENEKRLELLL